MLERAEEWRKLDGWPYEVSDHGRVRRAEPASGVAVGQILLTRPDRLGYLRVGLRRRGERQRPHLVHRLVAEAFVGERPSDRHFINHKNGIKSDNRPENLEWVTQSENQFHAYGMGLQGRGEKHGRAKLTEAQVKEIRRRYAAGGVSQITLAAEYGVNQTLIGFIVRRVVWTHLDDFP